MILLFSIDTSAMFFEKAMFLLDVIFGVSPDCPNVINLAKGLNMDLVQPAIYAAMLTDCCYNMAYVTCAGTPSHPFTIRWTGLGLNGTINGTAIPSSILSLFLNQNSITGSIPNNLPSGLTNLVLYANKMSGDVPILPAGIVDLELGKPGYSGNHFTGIVVLNQPQTVFINSNWITDVIVYDTSQFYPYCCDLSNNPLLGNPDIANLTMCTQSSMYSASTLPKTSVAVVGPASTGGNMVQGTTALATSTTTYSLVGSVASSVSTEAGIAIVTISEFTSSRAVTTLSDLPLKSAFMTLSDLLLTTNSGNLNLVTTIASTFLTNLAMTSAITVQFQQDSTTYILGWERVLRVIASFTIIIFVFTKAPFCLLHLINLKRFQMRRINIVQLF